MFRASQDGLHVDQAELLKEEVHPELSDHERVTDLLQDAAEATARPRNPGSETRKIR